jgi:hypothetical protein
MTPCTRVKTAKQLVLRAKKLERYGDTAQALIDYRQGNSPDLGDSNPTTAASLISDGENLSKKIKKKIAQLEKGSVEVEEDSPVHQPVPIDWRLADDDEGSPYSNDTSIRSSTGTPEVHSYTTYL